ncbi:TPA: hypothetical protein GXZ54_00515 [bacterium]|jgi:replication initiation and membrane attachment protein|nr:hypothetical protein [bacterium]
MDFRELTSTDMYEIKLDGILSSYDYKVLTRLYQPIIGFGAVSLFITLWSELEADQTYSTSVNFHERLFGVMQCNTYQFIEFRKRLEAAGLLTTYVKKNKDDYKYLYILKSPLSPCEFFEHPLYSILLKRNLKDVEFEKTKTIFIKVGKPDKDYVDVSASFNEVYSYDKDSDVVINNDPLLGKEKGLPRVDFDFDTLIKAFKDFIFPINLLLTDEIKTEIASLASVYNIGVYDMRGIIQQSLQVKDNKRYIDVKKLRENAHNYARTYLTIPAFKQEQEKIENQVSAGQFSDKVEMFNNLTPIEFLTIKNGGVPPIPQDVAVIDELNSKTNLTDPVINVLLDYTLITQDNKLIKDYVMKIAGTLMRSRIMTAVDAMIYFNNSGRRKKDVVYEIKKDEPEVVKKTQKFDSKIDEEGYQAFLDFVKAGDKNGKN